MSVPEIAQSFYPNEIEDAVDCAEWVSAKLFILEHEHLFAREKIVKFLKLDRIKAARDVSVPAWPAPNACLLITLQGIEKFERLLAFFATHVPLGKGALDWISQGHNHFHVRVVSGNALEGARIIKIIGRDFSGDAPSPT